MDREWRIMYDKSRGWYTMVGEVADDKGG